ncbi:uncharacterized protein TNCV_5040501 [Trichonephila clavipes]|nr:uncharacterized protein TNCV_5040501 [Trichonephila clavipes]
MKIHPDKTRSYVQCKHCPDLQLTPNHILECPTVATKLLKMGMVPLRDSLRELLYSPDAPRIAEAFTCRNCGGGDRGRVAIYRPFGEVSLSLNRTVTCMVLKANDRRTSCPCHDEFRGTRSDYVRQVALATTTTTTNIEKELRGSISNHKHSL